MVDAAEGFKRQNQKVYCKIGWAVTSKGTTIKSHRQHYSWEELKKDDINGHANVDGMKPTRPQPYTENYEQLITV